MKKQQLKVNRSTILELTPSETKKVAGGNIPTLWPCRSYDIPCGTHASAVC